MNSSPVTIGAVLSLTGRFARFGLQAARGRRIWSAMTGAAELHIEDDGGERSRVIPALEALAGRCDVLLGPYSTVLMRSACAFAKDSGRLVWNHGGSGDDIQTSAPGHVLSVLTPTSRYAEPFIQLIAERHPDSTVRFVQGKGSFGRQVIGGARDVARRLGVPVVDEGGTALFTAGSFEEDTALITGARAEGRLPPLVGTVAAGVREFARAVDDPDGIFGVAQWFPGQDRASSSYIGPAEGDLVAAYVRSVGSPPDYPAIQAIATAALAVHCVQEAGSTTVKDLWAAAAALRAQTLFGEFSIDGATGVQLGHRMALVRWRSGQMETT
jgi:ABC-type branched-subunit amino acid transport system substrate-binding protein